MMTSDMNVWQAAGMVYVLAGAALLCSSIFLSASPVSRSSSDADRDIVEMRRLSRQWLDSRVGAVLVVMGFFFELTGSLGTMSLNGPGAIVLVALALGATFYALMRDSIVEDIIAAHGVPVTEEHVAVSPPEALPAVEVVQEAPPNVVSIRREVAD